MGTYTVGTTGTYADFSVAEAALTLPEVGGTIYEISGTISILDSLIDSLYLNGLTVRAAAGEECDGKGGGTAIYANRLNVATTTLPVNFENIRISTIVQTATNAKINIDKCVLGESSTEDSFSIDGTIIGTATNCIFQDGSDDCVSGSAASTAFTFDQCTLVDASRYNVLRGLTTNCLALGGGTGDYLQSAAGSDYNAASDTSAPGTTVFNSRTTADLVNYAGGDYNLASGSSLVGAGSGGKDIGAVIDVVAVGPTLTGPDTTTVDATRTVTGTALDTATTAGLKIDDDSYSKSLTITPIDTVSFSQVDAIDSGIALGTPVASLPVEADVLAATATPYQIQQWVDDGINPEVSRNITLSYLAAHSTVQTMLVDANTDPAESFFGTTYIVVEDDMQFSHPDVVDGVTLTVNDAGEPTTSVDQTISFTGRFWSPSTGQASYAGFTVKGSAIISGGASSTLRLNYVNKTQFYIN